MEHTIAKFYTVEQHLNHLSKQMKMIVGSQKSYRTGKVKREKIKELTFA